MAVYDFPHKGRAQTARWMYGLAQIFKNDIGDLALMPFDQYFDFIRGGPYANDEIAWGDPEREVLARPAYLLKWQRFPGLDCKKKAIMIGAWAERNRVPWELIGMSERADKEIHHVFPVLWDGEKWVNADATYPRYFLGQAKPEMTAAERFAR